jgi:TPR repeat protein
MSEKSTRIAGLWVKVEDYESATEATSQSQIISFFMAFGYAVILGVSIYTGRYLWGIGEDYYQNDMDILNGLSCFFVVIFTWLGFRINKGKYGLVPLINLWFFIEVIGRIFFLASLGVNPAAGFGITIPLAIIAVNSCWGWFSLNFRKSLPGSPRKPNPIERKPIYNNVNSPAQKRLDEEQLYSQVATEMNNKDIKAGLWAKATVDAEGDEGKTKAFYIKYRVQNIQDEQRERLIEIELKNTQLKAEAEKKRLESIITAKEMAKHATHRTQEGQMLMSQLNIKYDGGKYDGGNYIYSNHKYHLLEHAVNYALKDQKVKDFNINLEEDKIKLETNNQDSYYKTIAGSNDPCTQYDFGIELEKKGKFADAMLLLEAAANQGHISAQYKLGLIYKKGGSGVEKDYTQALKWFRASSEKNYSGGYYQMGLMYLDGLGVAKDINQAIIWFQASLKEGNKLAEEELNKINDSLSKPKKALSSDLDDDILLTDLKNRIAKAKMNIK